MKNKVDEQTVEKVDEDEALHDVFEHPNAHSHSHKEHHDSFIEINNESQAEKEKC